MPEPAGERGKALKKGTKKIKHRVATMFRLAAQSLHRSPDALGAFLRRKKNHMGHAAAITATAHKLARIYYHLMTTREAYDGSIFAKNEEEYQERQLRRLKREAERRGMVLSPAPVWRRNLRNGCAVVPNPGASSLGARTELARGWRGNLLS